MGLRECGSERSGDGWMDGWIDGLDVEEDDVVVVEGMVLRVAGLEGCTLVDGSFEASLKRKKSLNDRREEGNESNWGSGQAQHQRERSEEGN